MWIIARARQAPKDLKNPFSLQVAGMRLLAKDRFKDRPGFDEDDCIARKQQQPASGRQQTWVKKPKRLFINTPKNILRLITVTLMVMNLKRFLILALVAVLAFAGSTEAFAKKKETVDPAAEAAAAAAKAAADAEAAKKKEEAAIQKAITPINKGLEDLMRKYQARLLFSPADAGKLSDIKFQLTDLTNQYPESPFLSKSVYQAGFLLAERGQYDDAYELLTFLTSQATPTPYSMKAKVRLYQMQKELGQDYFDAIHAAVGSNDASGATKNPAAAATKTAPPKK